MVSKKNRLRAGGFSGSGPVDARARPARLNECARTRMRMGHDGWRMAGLRNSEYSGQRVILEQVSNRS